jgi:zinc protease
MNSSEAIAGVLAVYVSLTRSPETLNKVFSLFESITPEDIRSAAQRYFKESGRTIVTLSTKQGSPTASTGEGKK